MKSRMAAALILVTALCIASLTLSCSPPSNAPGPHVAAKNSTGASTVFVLTGRYEKNLVQIMNWLPERWDLVAVLKWDAYGNDIHILGPVAARVAPAVAVRTNEDAEALTPYHPKSIIRISPTSYKLAKEAVDKHIKIQEFIGTLKDLEAVTRVAKEKNTTLDASIYLFDHYNDPWGFEFKSPEELEQLVDSIDPKLVKIRGIFTHLGYLESAPDAQITERIQKFLRIACPVAVKLASKLGPDEPPFLVHWAASSELSRLWNPTTEKVELTPNLNELADVCMSHPKVNFAIRVGSATFGSPDFELPNLQPILWWTSVVDRLYPLANTNIAVVNVGTDNGYPRYFRRKGKWGEVSISGERYPLAGPPQKNQIEIDVGPSPNKKTVFVGAKVCLLCDKPTIDDLFHLGIAEDTYNIAMCATGASSHFAEESYFLYDDTPACVGPIVVVEPRNIRGNRGQIIKQ